ncbi:MAG: hypothetical protein D6786_02590 [Gammaproteobacteria bacterium]|nr:MAG: hypothetical protein D6786_02590 [Gammaproteobacteria bacterium]
MSASPCHPIVYIRGYAGTQAEVEDTVADPYMGFNIGSTKLRQRWTGEIDRHIFESPLIRLMKEHGYMDAFRGGAEFGPGEVAPARSVWIYRYYEQVSEQLGSGERPEMETYALGLGEFLQKVRDRVAGDDPRARARFRVHLVAHSMGGLIARSYLQKYIDEFDDPVRVDKVFTYGTPHRGIDLRLIGNIPRLFGWNNADNFNVERMREYLGLDAGEPVNSLGGRFPPKRFFCLIGTDSRDYEVVKGLAALAVGPMSDGLVRIRNAYVEGAPRAMVHRAHSGHFGLVNSEEGYQNLTRFLFGDLRVEGDLEAGAITLPPAVRRAKEEGARIRASYHVEVVVSVRGHPWDLHRRTVAEQSAIFRPYDRWVKEGRPVRLFSLYPARWARVAGTRSLGFCLDLRILVPEYEVEGRLFRREYYAGGHLLREKFNLELDPDRPGRLRWGLDSRTPNRATRSIEAQTLPDGTRRFRIPVSQRSRPGFEGALVLRVGPWNEGPA